MAPPGEHTTRRTVLRQPRAPAAPAIWPDTKRGENPTHNPNPAAPEPRPEPRRSRPPGRARMFPGPRGIDNVYGPAGRTHSPTTTVLDAKREEDPTRNPNPAAPEPRPEPRRPRPPGPCVPGLRGIDNVYGPAGRIYGPNPSGRGPSRRAAGAARRARRFRPPGPSAPGPRGIDNVYGPAGRIHSPADSSPAAVD